jgi:hypothetical protein
MKSIRMIAIAIAVALGVPALALAQPAGRTGAARVDVGRMAAPVRGDIVRDRPDVVRVRGDHNVRRRAFEPNRRRFHDPNRRPPNHHARRRWNAANPPSR